VTIVAREPQISYQPTTLIAGEQRPRLLLGKIPSSEHASRQANPLCDLGSGQVVRKFEMFTRFVTYVAVELRASKPLASTPAQAQEQQQVVVLAEAGLLEDTIVHAFT
jgi:hypothetical protein